MSQGAFPCAEHTMIVIRSPISTANKKYEIHFTALHKFCFFSLCFVLSFSAMSKHTKIIKAINGPNRVVKVNEHHNIALIKGLRPVAEMFGL